MAAVFGERPWLKKRPRIQVVVACEGKRRSMVLVASALGHHIYLSGPAETESRVIGVGLDLELLDRIETGRVVLPPSPEFHVEDAIDHRCV